MIAAVWRRIRAEEEEKTHGENADAMVTKMAAVLMITTLAMLLVGRGGWHGNDGSGEDDDKDGDADVNAAVDVGDADAGGHGDDGSDGMGMVAMTTIC